MGEHHHSSSSSSGELIVTPFKNFGEVVAALDLAPRKQDFDLSNVEAMGLGLSFKGRLEATQLDGETIWSYIENNRGLTESEKKSYTERLLNACDLQGNAFTSYDEVLPALFKLDKLCKLYSPQGPSRSERRLSLFELEAEHIAFRLRFQDLQFKTTTQRYEAYIATYYQEPVKGAILALIEGIVIQRDKFNGVSLTQEQKQALLMVSTELNRQNESPWAFEDDGRSMDGEYPAFPPESPSPVRRPLSSSSFHDESVQMEAELPDNNVEAFLNQYPSAWYQEIHDIVSQDISPNERDQQLIQLFAYKNPKDDDLTLSYLVSPFRVYGYSDATIAELTRKLKQGQQNVAFIRCFPKKYQDDIFNIISKASSADMRERDLIRFVVKHSLLNGDISTGKLILRFKNHYGYSDEKVKLLQEALEKWLKHYAFIFLFPKPLQQVVETIILNASSEMERDQLIVELLAEHKKKNDRHSLENEISRFIVYDYNDEKCEELKQNLKQWQKHFAFIRCFPEGLRQEVYAKIKDFNSQAFKDAAVQRAIDEETRENAQKLAQSQGAPPTFEVVAQIRAQAIAGYQTLAKREQAIQTARELALIEFVVTKMPVAEVWPLLERAFSQYDYQEADFGRLNTALCGHLLKEGTSSNKDFRETVEAEALSRHYLFPLYMDLKEALYIGYLEGKILEGDVKDLWFQLYWSDQALGLSQPMSIINTDKLINLVEKIQAFLSYQLSSKIIDAEPSFKLDRKAFYDQLRDTPVDSAWDRAEAKESSVKEEAEKIWDLYQQKKSAAPVTTSREGEASAVETTNPADTSDVSQSPATAETSCPAVVTCPSITRLVKLNIKKEYADTRDELAQMHEELEAKNAVEFIYNTIMQHSWRVGLLGKVKDIFGVGYKEEEDFHKPGHRGGRASKLSRHQEQMIHLLEPFFPRPQGRSPLTNPITQVVPDSWVTVLGQLQAINNDAKANPSRLRSRQMQDFYDTTEHQLHAVSLSKNRHTFHGSSSAPELTSLGDQGASVTAQKPEPGHHRKTKSH